MRRLLPVVLATLLAAVLVAPAAIAATGGSAGVVVVAAEGTEGAAEEGGEAEPVGPEPDLGNTNAPADYEPPFLINAAVGLTALLLLLVLGLGGLYWLLVQRPRASQS